MDREFQGWREVKVHSSLLRLIALDTVSFLFHKTTSVLNLRILVFDRQLTVESHFPQYKAVSIYLNIPFRQHQLMKLPQKRHSSRLP